MSRPERATAWVGGLVAAAVLLRLAAVGDLAAPPLGAPGDLADWVDAREPVAVAVALVRLLAELGVWYVLAVSGLHVAAAVLRAAGAHRAADALAVPAVRRLVRAGLGLGVVAASSLPSPGPSAGPPPGTATMAPAGTAVAAPAAGTAAMRPPPPTTATTGTATMRPVPDAATSAPPPPIPTPTTWTVEPGDSLWSIAEEVLADRLGRPPGATEVDPWWRSLVERNRPRLVDPADPDLLLPGQVLELPPLP